MRLTRSAILALSLLAPVLLSGAQAPPQQPKGTGVVVGQVIDGVTGRPIAEVAVTPTLIAKDPPAGRFLAPTATDSDGHFVLRGLPAGSIGLEARQSGYIDGVYGAEFPDGAARRIDLADADKIGDVVIRLWPNATLGGQVLDDRGEPVVDVAVQALKRSLVAGRWRLGENYSFLHQARTDDRGEYRITDVTPGDYVMVVANTVASAPAATISAYEQLRDANPSSPQYQAASASLFAINGPGSLGGTSRALPVDDMVALLENPSLIRASADTMPMAFPTVFYPGVEDASAAQLVTISAGQERLGLDFTMRPVKSVRLSGTVTGPSGPAAGIPLRLQRSSADQLQGQFDSAATVSGAGGTFTFIGVTRGDYTLRALDLPRPTLTTTQVGATTVMQRAGEATAQPTLWGNAAVTIGDTDIKDVAVTLSTGARISGTAVTEGAPPSGPPRAITVDIEAADARLLAARAQLQPMRATNGTFASQQLPSGRYILRVSGNGASSATITLQGRDITEVPVELGSKDVTDVAISVHPPANATIGGTLRPGAGGNLARATVLAFPVNQALWVDYGANPRRMVKSGASKSGGYLITTLPAGDYTIIAVDSDPNGEWRDPAFLAALAPLGTTVTIRAGLPSSQDLTVVKLPAFPAARREPIDGEITISDDGSMFVPGPYVPDELDQQQPARDATAQRPAIAGDGALAGVVIEKFNSTPVRSAAVALSCPDAKYGDTAITDATGRFAFHGIPVTRCTLSVTKPSFLSMRYGATEPGKPGTPIAVNGPMRDVTIGLQRSSAITGTIRDERGLPVRGVTVIAMSYEISSGERTLAQTQRALNPTDSQGNYRIFGLSPGEYYVAVNRPNIGFYQTLKQTTPGDYKAALKELESGAATAATSRPDQDVQQEVGYTTTYYPGTPFTGSAGKITLAAGENHGGTDITLSVIRLATVKVRVTGPDGQPTAGVLAHLFREENVSALDQVGSMMLPFPQPGNVIAISGVAPGRYIVDAGATSEKPGPLPDGGFSWSPGNTTGLPMYGQTSVTVDGADVEVDVQLSSAVSITARVAFENSGIAANTPPVAGLRVGLFGPKRGAMELRTLFNPADASGVIKYDNLVPAAYRVQTTAPRGWMIKSATINGVDAADIPVDITSAGGEVVVTFTDRVTELSGKLQSSTGTPEPGYTVIAFAADKKYWRNLSRRIVTARPATDGRFVFTGIPPGEYRIAAVTDVKPGEWFDPAFLEQLVPASAPVTVADGEKKVQNLVIK